MKRAANRRPPRVLPRQPTTSPLVVRALSLFDALTDPANRWASTPEGIALTADIVMRNLSLGDRAQARRVIAAVLAVATPSDVRRMVADLEEDHADMHADDKRVVTAGGAS